MYKLIIALSALLITFSPAFAEPKWAAKPIQCGSMSEVVAIIQGNEEEVLLGAISRMVTEDMVEQNNIIPMPVVVYMFFNSDSRSFTMIEFHSDDEVCVIAFGDAVVFDPEELNKFLKEYFDDQT